MSCYRVHVVYRLPSGEIVGDGPRAAAGVPIRIPCGSCVGCLMERRQQWALRCQHEASCWDHNVFLTLTYDDEHLPWHGSLSVDDLQRFFKRLRRRFSGELCVAGTSRFPIRYFACGEYGSRTRRAHYHALVFNLLLPDAVRYGDETWTSGAIAELWPYGSHLIGSVTPKSAAYVAGYATKKVVGLVEREAAYEVVHPVTGECVDRTPEFAVMSRRPGIGQYWYDRYKGDLRHGYLVHDGRQIPVPRYYESKYGQDFPETVESREYARYVERVSRDPVEATERRLRDREAVVVARTKLFRRESLMEDGHV